MHLSEIRVLEQLFVAATGILSIYLGYRLFSDVPVYGTRTLGIGRVRVPTTFAAAALLTILGISLLATGTRGALFPTRRAVVRYSIPDAGTIRPGSGTRHHWTIEERTV